LCPQREPRPRWPKQSCHQGAGKRDCRTPRSRPALLAAAPSHTSDSGAHRIHAHATTHASSEASITAPVATALAASRISSSLRPWPPRMSSLIVVVSAVRGCIGNRATHYRPFAAARAYLTGLTFALALADRAGDPQPVRRGRACHRPRDVPWRVRQVLHYTMGLEWQGAAGQGRDRRGTAWRGAARRG